MHGLDEDKSEQCIPFILERLHEKNKDGALQGPLFVGLSGAQGSGKTTLVSLTKPRDVVMVFSAMKHCRSRQPSTFDLSWLWVTSFVSILNMYFRCVNPCQSSQAFYYIVVAPV